jgi:predicted outer membrane protein
MNKYVISGAIALAMTLGVSAPSFAQKAAAAPAAAPAVNGVAWANIEAAEAASVAFKTAETQRPVTYKQYYDQAEARSNALSAQLKPLVDKFNVDRAAANPNQASLQQPTTIQQLQQNGQQELQRIMLPVAYSQAYVAEQIEAKLPQAVNAAMAKRGVSLLFKPDAFHQVNGPAYNLTADITAQIDALVPSAQITPPAGWEPREVREAKAQQAGQAAPAAAPAAGGASRN